MKNTTPLIIILLLVFLYSFEPIETSNYSEKNDTIINELIYGYDEQYFLRRFSNTEGELGRIEGIRQTEDGGYICCVANDNNNTPFYVIKTNSFGVTEWVRSYPELCISHYDLCMDIFPDKSGGYVLLSSHYIGYYSGKISKLDNDGVVEWTHQIIIPSKDVVLKYGLQSEDLNYVVCGSDQIIKVGQNGEEVWRLSLNANVELYEVASWNNMYYSCGKYRGGNDTEICVVKFSDSGTLVDSYFYDTKDHDECAINIDINSQGDILVAGWKEWYSSTFYFNLMLDPDFNQKWYYLFFSSTNSYHSRFENDSVLISTGGDPDMYSENSVYRRNANSGALTWAKREINEGYVNLKDIHSLSEGGFIASGSFGFHRPGLMWRYNTFKTLFTEGKHWSVKHVDSYGIPSTEIYKVENDTILENKQYKKIMVSYDSLINWSLDGFIREESGLVYYKHIDEQEGVLYNFNLSVFDSVSVINKFSGGNEFPLYVVDLDTVEIEGRKRKRWTLSGENVTEYWIEGIGSLSGPIHAAYGECIVCPTWELLCYHNNSDLLYLAPGADNCYIGVGIDEKRLTEIIQIYPNPLYNGEYLTVNTSEPLTHIRLVNNAGMIVKSYESQIDQELIIQVSGLPVGFYYIIMETKSGKLITKKAVILNDP